MTRKLRIAIADDEEDIRQYFRRLLPRLGHELVGEAKNGRELVELCRTTKPDLIITDVRMPELNGLKAATEIRKTLSVPIIVLSAHEKPNREDNKFIVDYLQKPVSVTDLQAAINRACPAA